jgi:hypothetical protein
MGIVLIEPIGQLTQSIEKSFPENRIGWGYMNLRYIGVFRMQRSLETESVCRRMAK